MNFRLLLILMILLSSFVMSNDLSAQSDNDYVQLDTSTYTLGFSTRYRQYDVKTGVLSNIDKQAYQVKKHDISLGLRIRYKALNLAIIYGVLDLYNDQLYTPGLINVDVKLYPGSFFVKYNFQYGSIKQTIPQMIFNVDAFKEDTKVITTSLWGAYLFQGEKVSLSSSYSFVDRQKKSAGSFMLNAFTEYNHFNLNQEDEIFEKPDTVGNFLNLDDWRMGFGAGYTYSLVYKDFVFNAIVTGNIELTVIDIEDRSKQYGTEANLGLNPNLKFNTSALYYFGTNYVGVISEHYPRKYRARYLFDKRYWWFRFCYGYKF